MASKGKKLGEKILKVSIKSDHSSDVVHHRKSPHKVEHFQELTNVGFEPKSKIDYKLQMDKVPNEYFVYAALIICIIILMLPHEDNSDSQAQTRLLEVGVNLKLAVSFNKIDWKS